MSWPPFRTEPVRPSEVGPWPILSGCVVALLGVPVLTFAVALAVQAAFPAELQATQAWSLTARFAQVSFASPFVAWIVLPVAIPIALKAAAVGWAGWLASTIAGTGAAGVVLAILTGLGGEPIGPAADSLILIGVGTVLGGAFWLGARLAAPSAFAPRVTPGRPAAR